ncbi:hypothetical protein MKX03_025048 [Papaver bracteatum]|nr:hypothetical protein MKX03_025048 [Papaver bracteatum]
MDLLQSYTNSDDEEEENPSASSPTRISLPSKSSAPTADDTTHAFTVTGENRILNKPIINPIQHVADYNPTYDQLWAPIYGPGITQGMRNHQLGFAQNAAIDTFVFDEQYNAYYNCGYAADPSASSGTNYVGDLDVLQKNDGISVYNVPQSEQRKRKFETKIEQRKDEANDVDNPASENWLKNNRRSPWAGKKGVVQVELTAEQKKYAQEHAAKKAAKEKKGSGNNKAGEVVAEKSTFHGKEEKDYQGRSWIAPPKDTKAKNDRCYLPKKLIHTWSGHAKGVSAIRFFPKQGHLLLSAGMDSKVKIWDVHNSGHKCMRTYMGHGMAVRDISFSNDGTKFLSAGFDKNIKYWDTERGQVISSFSTGKVPIVAKQNPDDDKQNILLAGMDDKKVVQWDMNSGRITQEYQHLGAVNTITFVDDNRRFATSSDDKSLRVWEFGIPVVVKYISEPSMHSMPAISLHPDSNWLAAQSLDNKILVYSAREKFQLNKKKMFAGHIVAGYACQVNFSPDGQYIMSGDGEGKCRFWNWKTCKISQTLKCHEGVCIGVQWHPSEQSKVATCGWDGMITNWD